MTKIHTGMEVSMVTWTDYLVKQEQYKDQLRDAEKQHLIKQVTGDCAEGLMPAVKRQVSAAARRRSSEDENPYGGRPRMAEKAT
jgi:hypothetical protein